MKLYKQAKLFFCVCLAIVISACFMAVGSDEVLSAALPETMYFSDDGTQLFQGGTVSSGLYDETILRTIELHFEQADYWQQLEDNYNSEVEIPADLTMDGVTYPEVGVRFKGMTSYRGSEESQKKSFNISIDYSDSTQQLMGYKTLNLNNCFSDPSFMHEVLYFHICRQYIPASKANFVKLVINDEDWGVYANVQQLNSDFIKEWFVSNDGDRFKVPVLTHNDDSSPVQGLTWLGNDVATYQQAYELRSANTSDPWQHLITVCDVLNNLPLTQITDSLNSILDIDRCLWFIAMENICIDLDGYVLKGADYQLYYEAETGRLHPLEYDGNETFNTFTSASQFFIGLNATPFYGQDNDERPLIKRLLSVPEIRQRYLAHVRTIMDEYLEWDVLEPQIAAYRTLIEAEVKTDTKKLTSNDEFDSSFADLKKFVTYRQYYLQNNPEVRRSMPVILSAACQVGQIQGDLSSSEATAMVTAQMGTSPEVGTVFLYYANGYVGPFERIPMLDDGLHGDGDAGDGLFGAEIPAYPVGSLVRYYIEARATDNVGTTAFLPTGAEHDVFTYWIMSAKAESSPVVINEFMASNQTTIPDPQGEYEDWIELKNISDQEIDLSGMFLSDKQADPFKWLFPEGTTIAPGSYLIVWADEDGGDEVGLHANFKLSADGEGILLVDTEAGGNAILDSVDFGQQEPDVAYGRYPDGVGTFQILQTPTPEYTNASPVSVSELVRPTGFNLNQNFPNPFNSSTTITFTLPESDEIELGIYNLLGQKIATLVRGEHTAGIHQIHWDARDEFGNELASGMYLYRLQSHDQTQSQRLLLLR